MRKWNWSTIACCVEVQRSCEVKKSTEQLCNLRVKKHSRVKAFNLKLEGERLTDKIVHLRSGSNRKTGNTVHLLALVSLRIGQSYEGYVVHKGLSPAARRVRSRQADQALLMFVLRSLLYILRRVLTLRLIRWLRGLTAFAAGLTLS